MDTAVTDGLGEHYGEGGTFADFTRYRYLSPVALHNGLDRSEPNACTLVFLGVFSPMEDIKDKGKILRIDASAFVPNGHLYFPIVFLC